MNLKKMVGYKAAEFVKDGMIVGLGTGSTAYYMVEAIGKRVKEEGLSIVGVTTSHRTTDQARELGIPLKDIDEVDHIDVTIDGADEISDDYQGIKGGGAAHLFEKMVANQSEEIIWIVDDSKMVSKLGAFPLPVEVVKFGCGQVLNLLKKENLNPEFRLNDDGSKLETDSGNYIIDLHLGTIEDPHKLASFLDSVTGVVEHGLFLDSVTKVIVGREDGPEVIDVER
ncbi:ribose-5-phosphate isomerase RpiA [Alkalibacterium pelagium]|uniref:Ribose-5-phosphate isomerase A n=1 Tax=Alkalibacterium pelagium TaxID=426702 RepID=A0A1H7EW65_9LACT|nr:ribose-5-phosphate isomerase RpiA [Alkalibacterium pelagium]GEN49597.1 ribose-5-phosphate isomerase A [Alkalibacterium pelagium]SEK18101.1 ribose-5-phosphate isomerase [Alkalibacterium pelagium]